MLSFSGTNGVDTVYTLNHPRGTNSNQEYTFDKSLETDLVIKVSRIIQSSIFMSVFSRP